MPCPKHNSTHLLVFEPRVEGHHLTYLRYITEDLLSANYRLTLALNGDTSAQPKIREIMGSLLDQVTVITLGDQSKTSKLKLVEQAQAKAGADFIFLNCLDEIASSVFRKAAFGLLPNASLRERMGGIYFRPRMLMGGSWSLNHQLKKTGFLRLVRDGWFRQVLFPDEFLCAEWKRKEPTAPIHFLPDPFPDNFVYPTSAARQELKLPADKKVFLFYGGPYRRKGLHLAVDAMLDISHSPVFLLCAGQQPENDETTKKLKQLEARGQALVINRYITDEEEKKCFAATDVVLLPYLQHFGSSGVLARAGGAGKPVIASDEELIGRRVRSHELGLVFPSGNATELRRQMEAFTRLEENQITAMQKSVLKFGATCTRQKFREAILNSLSTAM